MLQYRQESVYVLATGYNTRIPGCYSFRQHGETEYRMCISVVPEACELWTMSQHHIRELHLINVIDIVRVQVNMAQFRTAFEQRQIAS